MHMFALSVFWQLALRELNRWHQRESFWPLPSFSDICLKIASAKVLFMDIDYRFEMIWPLLASFVENHSWSRWFDHFFVWTLWPSFCLCPTDNIPERPPRSLLRWWSFMILGGLTTSCYNSSLSWSVFKEGYLCWATFTETVLVGRILIDNCNHAVFSDECPRYALNLSLMRMTLNLAQQIHLLW